LRRYPPKGKQIPLRTGAQKKIYRNVCYGAFNGLRQVEEETTTNLRMEKTAGVRPAHKSAPLRCFQDMQKMQDSDNPELARTCVL
jgi:hypothetical protein